MTDRSEFVDLACIAGDLGEMLTRRDDPELRQALELVRAVVVRAAKEIGRTGGEHG